jgi:hypothetical protein
MVNLSIASCLAGGSNYNTFTSFLSTCMDSSEFSQSVNLIKTDDIKELFNNEQAKANDLLTALNGVKDFGATTGTDSVGLVYKSLNLDEKINVLQAEIDDTTLMIETANQIFLDKIYTAPKKSSVLANLQDVSLGIFFGSLVLLTIIFTILQYAKTDGSLKKSLITFLVMIVIIVIIFANLKEVA